MKDIPVARGRRYLLEMIARGEHENQDFKYSIGDACKIARSISAFANRGGGHLLIGVKDNGVVAGVRNEEDVYVVEEAASLYCRPAQHIDFAAFRYDERAVVIRASVAAYASRPVMARDADGSWQAYYRVADENIRAHPLMVEAWRRRSAATCIALREDSPGRGLLALVARSGAAGVRPEDVAPALGISRRTASAHIVRLAAMRILDFVYSDGEFRVVAADSTEP